MELDLDTLLLAGVAAAVLGAGCYVLFAWLAGQGDARRIGHAAARARSAPLGRPAAASHRGDAALAGWLPSWLARLHRPAQAQAAGQLSPLRLRLLRAGLRDAGAEARFGATRTFLAVLLPCATVAGYALAASEVNGILAGALMLMAALAAWCLPSFWLDARVARRQRTLAANFPDAIDMIRLCVEAGQGLDAAMTRVEREIRMTCMPLYDELHMVNLDMRAGAARARALRNMAQRIGLTEVDALVTMLVQVERLGTSVSDALRIHSEVLRTRQRQRAQELAAKVPVKLLFPMIFCIFPALLIVLLGPAAISVIRTLAVSMGPG